LINSPLQNELKKKSKPKERKKQLKLAKIAAFPQLKQPIDSNLGHSREPD
jgi:hypothetical protein